MDTLYDNDNTCFMKLLQEFRSDDDKPSRRLSALCFPEIEGARRVSNLAKPTKLTFDDSFLNETVGDCIKKRKIEPTTSDSFKLNDSFEITSPWDTRKMKADLVEARSEITRLESRICQMETVHKETLVLFEQEKNSLQQSLEKERNSSNEMEQRLRILRKREGDLRQELLECQGSLKQDRLSVEKKYQTLLQDNMLLKNKYSELDSDSGNKITQLERKLAASEQQIVNIQEELKSHQETVEKLSDELKEKRTESNLWESDKAKLIILSQRVKELEFDKESHQAAMTLVKSQQNKLLRLLDLEKELTTLKEENKNLRQAVTNKLYLEDVVADLRSRVSVLQEREQEIVSLKVKVGVAEKRLEEWAELSKHILGEENRTASPISLRQCFENYQKNELLLTSENTQLQSRVKALEEGQQESQCEREELKSQISRLKLAIEQNNAHVNRLRKQNSLIVWERNDLRQLVDSCQKEFNMTSTAALDLQHISRIEALEKALDGYRKRFKELEVDPGITLNAAPPSDSETAELIKLKTDRDILLKEKEMLNKKVQDLLEQLEYRVLKGDFDVRQSKILHFRANPTTEATTSHALELEKCQAEIVRLRERVKLLQDGKEHDLTVIVNERVEANAGREVAELKDKLSVQERQNQRLTEAFKKTSHEFREAINLLLGYRVDARNNNTYRLSNLYADSPDQYLVFKMSNNGVMDLLETPYSETLGDLIDIHLHQHHSIPLFLSAITMQLFEKQSMSVSVVPNDNDAEIILSE